MAHDRLADHLRIETPDGNPVVITLPVRNGGRLIKRAQYQVVVHQESDNNVRVGLGLDHGPDGDHWVSHSTPLAVADCATTITSPP